MLEATIALIIYAASAFVLGFSTACIAAPCNSVQRRRAVIAAIYAFAALVTMAALAFRDVGR